MKEFLSRSGGYSIDGGMSRWIVYYWADNNCNKFSFEGIGTC